ncbi:MAG: cofactor-independent phosphoglycerate mutase [Planctomycetota bacterium]
MKYAIIIPDGCADEPIDALGGKTPLQRASVPAMDALAAAGKLGLANNTPSHFPAGSEVANLCLLGYDPDVYFTGRAPLEAAAQGIELDEHDFAIRCNLVTIEDQIMKDFTADHISTQESVELLKSANETLLSPLGTLGGKLEFVPGVSYRNLLVFRGDAETPAPFAGDTRSTAPHDLTDLSVADSFPRGRGSELLVDLMNASERLFADHPINKKRLTDSKGPATHVWLWGLGGAPNLPSFESQHGVRGVMITAVDLLRGIAALAGWPRIEVEGATGYLDTDYAAKGRAAVEALDEYDLVCVHVEAPDEASHEGRHDAKIEALDQIDQHVVTPIAEKLRSCGEHRILVTPDHPTFCRTKKHTHGMVPFLISGSGIEADAQPTYDEICAEAAGYRLDKGWDLMGDFIIR